MEKSLSNELFIVGVSLDCLRAGVPDGSFISERMSALSGQVLSDSKKVETLENLIHDLKFAVDSYDVSEIDASAILGERAYRALCEIKDI